MPFARRIVWATLLFSLAVGLPAWAQPPEIIDSEPAQDTSEGQPPRIPETVVPGRLPSFPANPLGGDAVLSATRTESLRRDVGSDLSVVTAEDIRRSGQNSVHGVLRTVVGVDVVQQGGPGGITSLFLRGANSQHTKVLLDGIPINDPSNATRGFDFSTLTVDNIERIEVLRGPQSILYGSDAIGGVVNIVTRRGEGPLSIQASADGGSFGTGRASVTASGGDSGQYFSLSASYFDTAGISQASRRLGNTERDGLDLATFSGRLGWTPTENLSVDYVLRYTDADAQVDDFDFVTGLPTDNLIRRNLSRNTYQRIQVQSLQLDGAIEQTVGFNFTNYDRRDTDTGSIFVPDFFAGQTRELDWQADLLVTDNHLLTAGASYLHEQALSQLNPLVAQHNIGAFVSDQFQVIERWYATAGVRWDDHSTAGRANTYRTTHLIRFSETGTDFHGSLGTGFRAPALAENLFQFGNPNLRPEHSKGWDAGVQQQLLSGTLLLDVTYFQNSFRDLIVFDFNTFSLQNVGRSRANGVEIVARWQPNEASAVGGNYTFTDTLDFDTGQSLLRRPRHKANLYLERAYCNGCARARIDFLFVGERLDTRGLVLDEFLLVNLSGSYDLNDCWTVYARVDNLLDENYEQIRGYGVAGISAFAGLSTGW